MRAGKGAVKPLARAPVPEEALAGLSEGQREAARSILESRDRVVGVQGLAFRSANDIRYANAIVPGVGFTACRPCMNVPANGIIHAGPGSQKWTVGDGRTQASGSFVAVKADKRCQWVPSENATGCTRPRSHLIP